MLFSPPESKNDTMPDFQRDVVEASHERPILVDFWAPWCGPCRTLGPVLEKLEAEAEGRWALMKINTDEQTDLSRQAGIRGIPAVKLYVDGSVIAEFTGALPEPIVRRWLDEHLPTMAKRLLEEGRGHFEDGQREEAITCLEQALQAESGNEEVRALLARLIALDDTARAMELLEGLQHRPEAAAVLTVDSFRRLNAEAELPESTVRSDYLDAARALRTGDVDQALEHLLGVLQKDRYYHDDAPRKVIVALFTILGESDPLTRKYRPVFNRSLY